MSFYQNPFDQEFRGELVLGDRKYSLTFKVPPNKNSSHFMMAWNLEPYDFSSDNTLTLNFAIDKDGKNFAAVAINVAGAIASATLALEAAIALNANATFADFFTAGTQSANNGAANRLVIRSKMQKENFRAYISNTSAEKKLKFNRSAGVAELPTFFDRHTIANRFTFTDSESKLVKLNEADATDQAIITEAGFTPGSMKKDWELLAGRAWSTFKFAKQTVNGTDQVTQIIEYPAGAKVGDLAIKTVMTYNQASDKNPATRVQVPYILQSGDLLNPS